MQIIEITRVNFEQWLDTKEPYEVVGYVATPSRCPVSRFAQEVYGTERTLTMLGCISYELYEGSIQCRYELPEWLNTFIGRLDTTRFSRTRITAAECKDLLEEV